MSYVRSHDIEIERSPQDSTALKAEIRHIQKLGPAVRVTLAIDGNGEFIEAELTRDVFQNLGLQQGESGFCAAPSGQGVCRKITRYSRK